MTVTENGKRRQITKREAVIAELVNKSAAAPEPPHPNPLPASGERERPAKREGEGQRATNSAGFGRPKCSTG